MRRLFVWSSLIMVIGVVDATLWSISMTVEGEVRDFTRVNYGYCCDGVHNAYSESLEGASYATYPEVRVFLSFNAAHLNFFIFFSN